jgi:hypothetical protein
MLELSYLQQASNLKLLPNPLLLALRSNLFWFCFQVNKHVWDKKTLAGAIGTFLYLAI